MKILFEGVYYGQGMIKNYDLESYAAYDMECNTACIPYVGYMYSPKIEDVIFILPKVFLFKGSGIIDSEQNKKEIAFGKYEIYDVIDANCELLKKDNLNKVIFGLSTWIYQAIDKYSKRNPKSKIIKRSTLQGVVSNNGNRSQTLLDIILSLIKFHKDHANLFTYISIVNSSGNNKIHWNKTIRKVQPIIQNGTPYYLTFQNKSKVTNFDEEIIILFYSVLEYLRHQYNFQVKPNLNYELLKPRQIDSMISQGRGTKVLRRIRHKYFKDELVQLWKLLYTFFDMSETIRSGKASNEALLASSFNQVFEDMIDSLIGDEIFEDLKNNDDGKEIDHLYKDKSIFEDSMIYYIGDSKYYSYDLDLDRKSLYKQFTYAKNIIQRNIDIFHKEEGKRTKKEAEIIKDVRYRDPLTKGYNFTPNYFIRGYINGEDISNGKIDHNSIRLKVHDQEMPTNLHFENKPFDRDTLVLESYNINFLYVLASYVNNSKDSGIKESIHKQFRKDLIALYNKKFDFFKVRPTDGTSLESFVEQHFYEYHGNMYHTEDTDFIWFAFDKNKMKEEHLSDKIANVKIVKVELEY